MIWAWIFFGLIFGGIMGYVIFLIKRYLTVKRAKKRIEKQTIAPYVEGKLVDMIKEIEKNENRNKRR